MSSPPSFGKEAVHRWKPHPWHGVSIGADAPAVITCFIEIVPTDTVKYEIDKASGYLKVDRPQKFSNVCPALYGMVPRTYCGADIAALAARRSGRAVRAGDGDPLDICVLSEKSFSHGDILLRAVPIGGLLLLDRDEADDKIIAVLEGDAAYGEWRELSQCPAAVVERLRHYFLTYKQAPGAEAGPCEITNVYGREEAHAVIRASQADYAAKFGGV
jgi:inorganic pyrophosphatase